MRNLEMLNTKIERILGQINRSFAEKVAQWNKELQRFHEQREELKSRLEKIEREVERLKANEQQENHNWN